MKKIMEKYGNSFGYVKGYFTLCGLAGLFAVIAGIILAFSENKITEGMSSADVISVLVIPGIILILIAVAIVISTRKKCPENKRGIVGLTLSMMLVGLYASILMSWWCFKKIMKLSLKLLGINVGSSSKESNGKQALADIYIKGHDESLEYICSDCGSYAILTGARTSSCRGETVSVHRSGDSNILCDDSNNYYYPLG